MFLKYYPKCRAIIDCTEVYIETPSSLEVAAMCWSNCKQHYTVKFWIVITPNGAISFASPVYRPLQKRERTGKEYGCFPSDRYSNERSTIF